MHARPASVRLIHFCLLLTGLALLALMIIRRGGLRALDQPLIADPPDAHPQAARPESNSARPIARISSLPMAFEANLGQLDSQAQFVARTRGANVFLTSTGAVFAPPAAGGRAPTSFRIKWLGAPPSEASGDEQLAGKVNYFVGNDRSRWRTNIPTYRKVRYSSVYPGIDLIYYGTERQLEYDFVVGPGANASAIRFAFGGVDSLALDGNGDLILMVAGREVRQKQPKMYQNISGERREILGGYQILARNEVAFRVGSFDPDHALVIDPVLSFSTYLGGTGQDYARGIALDGAGNIYVAGASGSGNFPTANPRQATLAGDFDVVVLKLNPTGSTLLYSTYLGGSGSDFGSGLAVDAAGNAYVTGYTNSDNFPTATPYQGSRGGNWDAFCAKLGPNGSTLLYSTYLGGSAEDKAFGVAIDSSGSAYLVGTTFSTNFPLQGAYQGTYRNFGDAFVTKLSPAGSGIVYSTYLGGSLQDQGSAIAVDGSGSAYVTGTTSSSDFPVRNGIQPMRGLSSDAFVTKIDPGGSTLTYSTYFGGSGQDFGYGITTDAAGNAYVVGQTASSDFRTASPSQATLSGSSDAFVFKLNSSGSALLYSSYLGGSGAEIAYAIAVDGAGNMFVTGETTSTNFPTLGALQPPAGSSDVFVTQISADGGTPLNYSTYLGGASGDSARAIALSGAGNAYIAGQTDSSNFPTANAIAGTYGGFGDMFIAAIGNSTALQLSGVSPNTGPTAGNTSTTLRGANFAPGATVTFGGNPAMNVSVTSAGTINATTPGHASGAVDVMVKNPDSTTSTLPNGFTYADPAPDGGGGGGGSSGKSGCGAAGLPPGLLLVLVGALRRMWRRRAP